MISDVILDWSGTVVDDLGAVLEATNHVLERGGVGRMTEEQFRNEFELPVERFYSRIMPGRGAEELGPWFMEAFARVQTPVTVLPFARGFLEYCRGRGLRVRVLTAVPEPYFRRQEQALGLQGIVMTAWTGVSDKCEVLGRLLEEQGLDPGGVLVVGDMRHDLEAARGAGAWGCAVLTGYQRLGQLREGEPHLVVEHLGELQSLLERSGLDPVRLVEPARRMPVPTVGAAVLNPQGEVLMVRTRKWSGLWGIPGGKIKYGEASEDALRRELLEETGLEVSSVRFVLVQDCIESAEFYRPEHFLLLNYVCECAGSAAVRLNHEAQEHRWMPLEEALGLALNQPTRVLLERLLRERAGEGVGEGRMG